MTQSEVFDQSPVTVHVGPLEVFEQAPPPPHHLEEAAAAVMVVLVGVEVAAKVVDSRGEQRDLNLRTAGPVLVGLVLPDDFLFVDSHAGFRVSRAATPGTSPGGQPFNVADGGMGRKTESCPTCLVQRQVSLNRIADAAPLPVQPHPQNIKGIRAQLGESVPQHGSVFEKKKQLVVQL